MQRKGRDESEEKILKAIAAPTRIDIVSAGPISCQASGRSSRPLALRVGYRFSIVAEHVSIPTASYT